MTEQKIYKFDNGYGASVIPWGYGREKGLLELAILDDRGHLCYDTPITDDVIGWLTPAEVESILEEISKLPPKGEK